MPDPSAFDPAHARRHVGQIRPLDLDQVVEDALVLTTIDGAEDYLQADLANLSEIDATTRHRAAITVQLRGTLRKLHAFRLFSAAGIPLRGQVGQEPQLTALRGSLHRGILRALTADRPFRFRVGVTDSGLRKQVIGRVEDSLGWINDPTGWDINITNHAGSWTAQVGTLHYSRRFPPLDRMPWSTTPLVAETLIRLAKPTPGMRVHDPCCGTATLLIATHRNAPGAQLTGTDHDHIALATGLANVQRHDVHAELRVANATPILAPSGSVDRVISNLPFGKQVGSHDDNTRLYPALLNETARVLARYGRAVLLTEDKQLLRRSVQRTKGLKISQERLLRYHGATPTAFVLVPTRH
jgi:tRNA (guanine6-N2)-methyltransferase